MPGRNVSRIVGRLIGQGALHVLRGPVSAQTYGAAGGELEIFYPSSRIARWNSFNLGEFLWPQSVASLLPLALILVGGTLLLRRWT